jgi:hypothetical protein
MKKNFFNNYDSIKDYIEDNNYLRVGLYLVGGIVGIWVLGKATMLLTDATKNFKAFYDEII